MKRKLIDGRSWLNLLDLQAEHPDLPVSLVFPSLTDPGYILETPALKSWINRQPKAACHLWLIDLRTLAHPIAYELEKANPISPSTWLKLSWGVRLSMVWPGAAQFIKDRDNTGDPLIRIVLVDDDPQPLGIDDPYNPGTEKVGYWRHRIYPEYKGGRKSKPKTWNLVTRTCYEVARELGIPVIKSPEYEADDILAHLVRNRQAYGAKTTGILTVDTDLLQLVQDEPAQSYWYNVLPFDRIRDEAATRAYWLKRHKTEIAHPRNIAMEKHINGDKSDNLPPGAELGLIDLWDPLQTLRGQSKLDHLQPPSPQRLANPS